MWMPVICKYNTFLYFWPTSAGEIYKNGHVFVYSSTCIHERNYQFFLLICSLYCQHQKVSLRIVVGCLYILYVHGCVNSGNLFSTPLLFCQHQKVIYFCCVYVHAEVFVTYFSFCSLLYEHQLVRFSWFVYSNAHECMSKVTIFSPHLLILLPTSGGDFAVLYYFFMVV